MPFVIDVGISIAVKAVANPSPSADTNSEESEGYSSTISSLDQSVKDIEALLLFSKALYLRYEHACIH